MRVPWRVLLCCLLVSTLAPAAVHGNESPGVEVGSPVHEPDPNHAPPGAPPWDMRYLLHLDPRPIPWSDLATYAEWAERNYQRFHQLNGICFTAEFEKKDVPWPTAFGDGGDSALWTGLYLATAVWRYQVTRRSDHLQAILEAIRGLHILTHISGTPGVLCRCAFPKADEARFRYPQHWIWGHRHGEHSMYLSGTSVPDPFHAGRAYPQMRFHTDTSRDQLTGVLFGIAVTWAFLKPDTRTPADHRPNIATARHVVSQIHWALNSHIALNPNKDHRWRIVDHTGRRGKEGAWEVKNHLKVQFMSVTRQLLLDSVPGDHSSYDKLYRKELDGTFSKLKTPLEHVFGKYNNVSGYYAHNLRHMRMYAMLLFEHIPRRRRKLRTYFRDVVWHPVREHRNTHFIFLYNAAMNTAERRRQGFFQLKALSKRPLRAWSSPLTGRDGPNDVNSFLGGGVRNHVLDVHLRSFEGYFVWQRPPWGVNEKVDHWPTTQTPGLSFLAPYWLGRFMNYVPAEGPAR